jgi:hypothetical protein
MVHRFQVIIIDSLVVKCTRCVLGLDMGQFEVVGKAGYRYLIQ